MTDLELLTRDFAELAPEDRLRVAKLRTERRARGLPLVPTPGELASAAIADGVDEACAVEGLTLTPDGDPRVLEKDEQRACLRLYRAFGCAVYWLSQARESGQTAGLPDLWIFHVRLGCKTWHEVKRQVGGALRPAQAEFQRYALATDTPYLAGDRSAAARWLLAIGAASRVQLLDAGEGITPAMLD